MTSVSITVVDIAVALVILISALYATMRGLIRETLSIFSWAAAAYVALRFFPTFRPMLREYVSPAWLSDIAVSIGLFIVVLVPLSFLSFRFSETVKQSPVGAVDRVLGLVFGVGRGLVVVGIAYLMFAAFVPAKEYPHWLTEARVYPVVQKTGEALLELVPSHKDFFGNGTAGSQAEDDGRGEIETTITRVGKTYGAAARRGLDTPVGTKGVAESSSR
jgi:membrane protein required for colicin V production